MAGEWSNLLRAFGAQQRYDTPGPQDPGGLQEFGGGNVSGDGKVDWARLLAGGAQGLQGGLQGMLGGSSSPPPQLGSWRGAQTTVPHVDLFDQTKFNQPLIKPRNRDDDLDLSTIMRILRGA